MSEWERDKRWSDRFLPEIKRILGENLIGEASVEEDRERNTDLIVLRMEAVRIACRVRRHEYLARYGGQFTIRRARPSGVRTELAKIVMGWGDYLFYGICDQGETGFSRWTLLSLDGFRLWFNSELVRLGGTIPGIKKPNGDHSSDFLAFSTAALRAWGSSNRQQMIVNEWVAPESA